MTRTVQDVIADVRKWPEAAPNETLLVAEIDALRAAVRDVQVMDRWCWHETHHDVIARARARALAAGGDDGR